MKILHIVSGMDPRDGGVTKAVMTMMEGLAEQKIDNEVVCLDSPEEDYIKNRSLVHGLGPSKTAWRYSSFLRPWLKNNLSDFNVIILHGLWQYHVLAVYQAWSSVKSGRPKLLVMPHGMLDPYFQKAKGRRLKAIRNWFFWKLVERKAVNQADCVLFTCETEKILSFQSFKPYQPKRAEVVGLGIPAPSPFTAAMRSAFIGKCGGENTDKCLLFISRIHPKKGIDLLINAYKELKQHAGLPALVVAGPGLETDFGREMQALAADTKGIIFTGMLEGDAKWGAFHSCSAMILPSHQENFGFVVVEALACGKPVLISNQVNIWREIEAGKAGITDDNTVEGTKRMLVRWSQLSGRERSEMEANASDTYKKYFSLHGASHRLSEVIFDVCKQ